MKSGCVRWTLVMKSTSVESELHSVSISALVDRHCTTNNGQEEYS